MTDRPLIVRLRNWIGDVVLGLPALRLLESQGYALELVARGGWAPSLLAGEGWPVHVQPSMWKEKVAQLRQLRELCRARDAGFDRRDNMLLLPVSLSSALEARLAGLRAVGVAKEGRTPLLSRSMPVIDQGHEAARYHGVATNFLQIGLEPPQHAPLHVLPARMFEARSQLAALGITGPYAVICPFAGGRAASPGKPTKTWPAFEAFSALAAQRLGLPVLLCPGPSEEAQAAARFPAAQVLPTIELSLFAAVLKQAALVVANDTGPGHVAAAVGTPVLSVLGPTVAERWAPWGPCVTVLQKPQPAGAAVWPTAEEGLAAALGILQGRKAPDLQQGSMRPPEPGHTTG